MTRFRSLAVGLGAGLVITLSGCGNGPPSSAASSGGGAALGTSGASLGAAKVTIQATDALQFSPKASTAKVGDVVEWDNTGGTTHNITFDADANNDISDGSFTGGAKWQVKFSTAGTYTYKCTIHPGMEGTITIN